LHQPLAILFTAVAFLAIIVPDQTVSVDFLMAKGTRLNSEFLRSGLAFLYSFWIIAWAVWTYIHYSLEKSGQIPRRAMTLWVPVVLVGVAAAWSAPISSVDSYYYVSYGRMVVDMGLSPYEHNLHAVAHDPLIGQLPDFWFGNICFYGPVALGLFILPNLVHQVIPALGIGQMVTILKFIWLAGLWAGGYVLYRLLQKGEAPKSATAATLTNPIILMYGIIDAHTEVLTFSFLLFLIYFLRQGKWMSASLAFSALCSIKLITIVAFPICFCLLAVDRTKKKINSDSIKRAAKFAGLFALVYGGVYALLKGGEYPAVLAFSKTYLSLGKLGSLSRIQFLLGYGPETMAWTGNLSFAFGIGTLCLVLLLSKSRLKPGLALSFSLACLYLTRTFVQTWYMLWFWPITWLGAKSNAQFLGLQALWTLTAFYLVASLNWKYETIIFLVSYLLTCCYIFWKGQPFETAEAECSDSSVSP
jgi:hypothetical protein